MKKQNEHSDIGTFVIGVAIAAVMIIIGILLKKVCWPLIKWTAKKAWTKLRGSDKNEQVDDAPQVEAQVDVPAIESGLRTPDIFKGHANLAPMKEFRL